ncbi:glucose/arabinose dehydrogenase [Methanocalculus sp. AMF5]|uniref:PQQ-dependent sugar dehydrogenase n=1 Tax=Methanocalculus sp. AMF5 TaxID=1198257 RepID=UPI00209D39AE|nr:PQQ-dependent sugar dehydrogenase [Methanocalculus sp. AMF5]MCP1662461.1 glucose/arabinose dehydrogenase [Methanocalculus sp. AMF5]
MRSEHLLVGMALLFCIAFAICPVQAQPQTENTEVRNFGFLNMPFNIIKPPLEGQERQQVGLDLVAEGFIGPVGLTSPDDGSGRLFVVDLIGEIRIIDENGTLLEEPFLNIRDQLVELHLTFDERGLLGLAFHPDFAESGRFFIYYSAPLREGAPEGWDHTQPDIRIQSSGRR